MIKFLNNLWLRITKAKVHYVAAQPPIEWGEGDATDLRNFFLSNTGQTLIKWLEFREVVTNSFACEPLGKNNREWVAGMAYGLRMARTNLLALAQPKPTPEEMAFNEAGLMPNLEDVEAMLSNRIKKGIAKNGDFTL